MPTRSKRTVAADDTSAIATGVTIPSRAPVQDAPTYRTVLSSGEIAEWKFPDPFKIIAFSGLIPDPVTAATIDLLMQEKTLTSDADPRKYVQQAQQIRGMYGIVEHMLVKPRFNPRVEWGDGKEVLGRTQLGFRDAVGLYTAFLLGPSPAFIPSSGANDPGGTANTAPDGDGVRQDAG